MFIDVQASGYDWKQGYKLCLGFVNPRPIALVSTVAADGTTNLAPFSWYNMVCANPPVVMFVPSFKRDGTTKDTLDNIRATGEFAIATVTEAIAEPMARCAAALPPEQSEFDFGGLTPLPATKVKPPLVKESPVNIECRLREITVLNEGPGGGSVVFGDIVAMHIADWVLAADGAIDGSKLRTVGRLGRSEYTTVNDPYVLNIPEV